MILQVGIAQSIGSMNSILPKILKEFDFKRIHGSKIVYTLEPKHVTFVVYLPVFDNVDDGLLHSTNCLGATAIVPLTAKVIKAKIKLR